MPASLVDWSTLPEGRLLSLEAQDALRAAIAELPPGLRAAFVIRDVEGLSTAECSQVQGISDAACKVRLHRARLALRDRLSGYFGEWVTTSAAATDATVANPAGTQASHGSRGSQVGQEGEGV